MPSTLIYKSGYPSTSRAVETSATIGADGLVTGTAVFVVPESSSAYPVNSVIPQSLFSALNSVALQGLFVETRSLEKRGGLHFLRLAIVGAINPPVFEERREISPRAFNKSETKDENGTSVTRTLSFDYLAETISVSAVVTRNTITNIPVSRPRSFDIWNRQGTGSISGGETAVSSSSGALNAYGRILTSESREERAGIVRITKSAQFVFE